MSSHREAPEISKDPVADSTDLYAFISPDKANTVTLIANYIPLESPGVVLVLYEIDRVNGRLVVTGYPELPYRSSAGSDSQVQAEDRPPG